MLMGIKGRDCIRTVFTGSDFGLFTYFLITHPSGETVKAHEGLNLSLIFDSANVGPVSYTHLTLPTSDLV